MLEIIIGGFVLFLFLKIFFALGFGLLKIALLLVVLSFIGLLLPIGLGLMIPIIAVGIVLHIIGWFLGLLF
jgi:hypothetical protein